MPTRFADDPPSRQPTSKRQATSKRRATTKKRTDNRAKKKVKLASSRSRGILKASGSKKTPTSVAFGKNTEYPAQKDYPLDRDSETEGEQHRFLEKVKIKHRPVHGESQPNSPYPASASRAKISVQAKARPMNRYRTSSPFPPKAPSDVSSLSESNTGLRPLSPMSQPSTPALSEAEITTGNLPPGNPDYAWSGPSEAQIFAESLPPGHLDTPWYRASEAPMLAESLPLPYERFGQGAVDFVAEGQLGRYEPPPLREKGKTTWDRFWRRATTEEKGLYEELIREGLDALSIMENEGYIDEFLDRESNPNMQWDFDDLVQFIKNSLHDRRMEEMKNKEKRVRKAAKKARKHGNTSYKKPMQPSRFTLNKHRAVNNQSGHKPRSEPDSDRSSSQDSSVASNRQRLTIDCSYRVSKASRSREPSRSSSRYSEHSSSSGISRRSEISGRSGGSEYAAYASSRGSSSASSSAHSEQSPHTQRHSKKRSGYNQRGASRGRGMSRKSEWSSSQASSQSRGESSMRSSCASSSQYTPASSSSSSVVSSNRSSSRGRSHRRSSTHHKESDSGSSSDSRSRNRSSYASGSSYNSSQFEHEHMQRRPRRIRHRIKPTIGGYYIQQDIEYMETGERETMQYRRTKRVNPFKKFGQFVTNL